MRRIGFIVVGVLLLAIAAVVLFSRSASMPRYNGRGADYWLDSVFAPSGVSRSQFATQTEALEAFHTMGKEALPFLVRQLECPDALTAKVYTAFYQRCPFRLRNRLTRPHYQSRQNAAEFVLMNLHETEGAVPDLVELAKRSSGTTRQLAFTVMLNRVQRNHPEYAAVFLPALAETDASSRFLGVELLTEVDNRSSNVVAEVRKLLNDPDDMVRVTAAYAVWQFSGETNRTVQVLKEELGKTNLNTYSPYYRKAGPDFRRLVIHHLFEINPRSPVVEEYFRGRLKSLRANERRDACVELQGLRRTARLLLPYISPLYDDPDVEVMKAAREVLRQLDPIRFNVAPL